MEKAGTPEQVDLAPIGTGPFQLVQYQRMSSLVPSGENGKIW
jgi:dipeptide transport system substrate-binding protein